MMDEILQTLLQFLPHPENLFNSLILCSTHGMAQKIHRMFKGYYHNQTTIFPTIVSFENLAQTDRSAPKAQWLHDLAKEYPYLDLKDCAAIVDQMEAALKTCQKDSDSLSHLSFDFQDKVSIACYACDLLKKFLTDPAKSFSSLWQYLEFLQKKMTQDPSFKLCFIDTFPHTHTLCLDAFRSFVQEHPNGQLFDGLNSFPHKPTAKVFFKEFDGSIEEASGIVQLIQQNLITPPTPKMAVISDDRFLLSKIEAQLLTLKIPYINKTNDSSLYHSEYGVWLSALWDMVCNPCGITLEKFLCHPFITQYADSDFQSFSLMFILRILHAPSKIIGGLLIRPQEASFEDLRALADHADHIGRASQNQSLFETWPSRIKDVLTPVFMRGSLQDFLTLHQKINREVLTLILNKKTGCPDSSAFDFVFEKLQQIPLERMISAREYKDLLTWILKQTTYLLDSSSEATVLLLSTKQAFSYDFDIAFIEGSFDESQPPSHLLIPKSKSVLIQTEDLLSHCLLSQKIYITYKKSEEPSFLFHLLADYKISDGLTELTAQDFSFEESPLSEVSISEVQVSVPLAQRPKEFSVTDLQLLKDDPYAFYAKNILHLYPQMDLATSLKIDYGSWAHFVLDQFIRSKAWQQGIPLTQFAKPLSEKSKLTQRFYIRLFPVFSEMDQEFSKLLELNASILTEHTVQESFQIEGQPISLSGTIDRIDIYPDGTTVIIDYKTGQLPTPSDIEQCHKIQLPLEARLWSQQESRHGKSSSFSTMLRIIRLKSELFGLQETIVPYHSQLQQDLHEVLTDLLTPYVQEDWCFKSSAETIKISYQHLARIKIN